MPHRSMEFLYSSGIRLLRFLYWSASWFNPKAKAFVTGRQTQRERFEKTFPVATSDPLVWFHCASLGEFEQGRPVIEALKSWKPSIKILLTFFSPSGYEMRKDFELADFVFYLPWDTHRNARTFVERVRPQLAVFVKYEFWFHYIRALNNQAVPLISISAIFRPGQVFFRPHGTLFRSMLKCFTHFFVQNNGSVTLLRSIGITSVSLAGDTRFDRVNELVRQAKEVPAARDFKADKKLMVIGSAWPEDMEVLIPFINENKEELKFIIAPHEISEAFVQSMEKSLLAKSVRYSQANTETLKTSQVLVVDNIGLLSRLYRYGEYAFVGGAYGDGLHNILEAACYGIPIFFGNKSYQKYEEAVELIALGGAFEVKNFIELKASYERLIRESSTYNLACEVTRHYVQENLGATVRIADFCKKILA